MNENEFKNNVHMSNYMWRNRRRMAWLAFGSMIVVTGLCFFVVPLDRLEKLTDVVTWFYMTMATVVGAYMGLSTYASVRGNDMYNPYGSPYGIQPGDPYAGQGNYNPNGVPVPDVEGDGRGVSLETVDDIPSPRKRQRLGRGAVGAE
jgi:hypothetical protein